MAIERNVLFFPPTYLFTSPNNGKTRGDDFVLQKVPSSIFFLKMIYKTIKTIQKLIVTKKFLENFVKKVTFKNIPIRTISPYLAS